MGKAGEKGDWKKKTGDRGGWKRLTDEAVKKLQAAPHLRQRGNRKRESHRGIIGQQYMLSPKLFNIFQETSCMP